MSRLSRGKKREHERAVRPAAPLATPVAVHVPADGPGASAGGVPVRPAPGEEIQRAVLNHLHRIALARGHAVLATVTDERIGYVVHLQVHPDGSSTFTAEPQHTAPPDPPADAPGESAPALPPRAVPESPAAPTFVLRALHEPAGDTPFGTAAVPTGVFGPPPVMDAPPADENAQPEPPTPADGAPAPAEAAPAALGAPAPVGGASVPVDQALAPAAPGAPAPCRQHQHQHQHPAPDPAEPDPAEPHPAESRPDDPGPTPTPARGFDAVAEAVLGEDPRTAAGEAGVVLLAEPLARVNEAVKEGRIEEAAALAGRTVAEASGTLGPEHPEVLRLRELTAYIAYLAGDPLRSFGISLGLARIRHHAGDTEAAYGDVQSASAAWRAVRDPEQGLRLGRDLIGLWTELTAEDGPAADDIEQLESARARMGRLAERARTAPRPSTG
ncbi:tetratricopeptide repeat protein [Streptomyces sp. NPDC058440]|uniref:tetratricopeptide repeat protein n=1 Tax=Streptomyces sp. NPDC058440 TaxID=3346501 RepID=UPI00365877BF